MFLNFFIPCFLFCSWRAATDYSALAIGCKHVLN